MSNNALAKAASTALRDSSVGDPFAQGTEGVGGTVFMKFNGATGNYSAGQDDEEIEHGTRFAADIFNSRWGWSFWWDGEVMDSFEDFIRENPLSNQNEPDELPEDPEGKIDMSLDEIRKMRDDRSNNFMDGWSVQAILNLRPIDGTDVEYTLKLNRGVAINAFDALRKSYSRMYKMKAGLIPVVEISADKYKAKAKGVGWRYAPRLKIVDWISEDDLISAAGDNPEDYVDESTNETLAIEAATETQEGSEAPRPRGRRGARGANLG